MFRDKISKNEKIKPPRSTGNMIGNNIAEVRQNRRRFTSVTRPGRVCAAIKPFEFSRQTLEQLRLR